MSKVYSSSIRGLFALWIIFLSGLVHAQANGEKPLRVFLIGNSFSQNAGKYLPQLAEDGGFALTLGRAELPGCPLKRHWELVEAEENNDPKGKAYKGKSLKELLSEGKWDIVTIQQASILSGDVNTYIPYAQNLYNYIKKIQPDAEVVIHQTWAYRSDAPSFSQTGEGKYAQTDTEMWEKSRAAYHSVAARLGIRIIPVGDAFHQLSAEERTAYKKDTSFIAGRAAKPRLPDQKNSLHVGYFYKKEKLEFDSHHANDAGCYLGGLVWYGFLFKSSPAELKFRPKTVDRRFAKQLRIAAAEVITSQ